MNALINFHLKGKKGQYVWVDGSDEEALSKGVYETYTGTFLRYSQVAPLDIFVSYEWIT